MVWMKADDPKGRKQNGPNILAVHKNGKIWFGNKIISVWGLQKYKSCNFYADNKEPWIVLIQFRKDDKGMRPLLDAKCAGQLVINCGRFLKEHEGKPGKYRVRNDFSGLMRINFRLSRIDRGKT